MMATARALGSRGLLGALSAGCGKGATDRTGAADRRNPVPPQIILHR
jgi:hypothetical protein